MLETWPDFGNSESIIPECHNDDDYDDYLHGQVSIDYLG